MFEPLRAALREMDVEIGALEARLTALRACRASLAVVLGDVPSPPLVAPAPDAAAAPLRPARSRKPGQAGDFRANAADAMLAYVTKHGSARKAELVTASGVSLPTVTRIVADLVAAKRLAKTGKKSTTRYHLPGRATVATAPADSEGDRGARRAARRR